MANESKKATKPRPRLKPGLKVTSATSAPAAPAKPKLPPRAVEDCCAPGKS